MAAGGVQRRRRRNAVFVGVSVLAHVLVFAIIGLTAPRLAMQFQPTPATNIWLMPRLNRRAAEIKARADTAASSAAPISATANRPPAAQVPSPIAAAPAPTAPSASSPASGSAAGPPGAAETGAGVTGALRTSIGCEATRLAHLTPEEKDRCNQRLGEEARRGPKFIDMIPPEKRAYYDAVQQAYQAAHDPAHPFVRDAVGDVHSWGKGPGVGCGMKFGGPPQPPDHRSVTDKIKATGLLGVDLGPLRCGIVIPQGSMTPEIGIPVP